MHNSTQTHSTALSGRVHLEASLLVHSHLQSAIWHNSCTYSFLLRSHSATFDLLTFTQGFRLDCKHCCILLRNIFFWNKMRLRSHPNIHSNKKIIIINVYDSNMKYLPKNRKNSKTQILWFLKMLPYPPHGSSLPGGHMIAFISSVALLQTR